MWSASLNLLASSSTASAAATPSSIAPAITAGSLSPCTAQKTRLGTLRGIINDMGLTIEAFTAKL
jgi:hypothetical protein